MSTATIRIKVKNPVPLALCALLAAAPYLFPGPERPGVTEPLVQAGARETTSAKTAGPQIAGCPIFPADNVWNVPVVRLGKDPHSGDYIASIGPEHAVHPDFGSDFPYGIPYTVIAGSLKRVPVTFDYSDESDLGNYPIPANVAIEGGPSSRGDRHIVLMDKDRCILYELFAAEVQRDGSWKAGAGIRMDLTDNSLRGIGKASADAAGLPILPGLVRYDEVESGEIDHALRFTAPKTRKAFIWPARHSASNLSDAAYPPMGARFRLKATFDISGFSKSNQVILTALQHYGMILADNGGAWFISGAPDHRWNDRDLRRLGQLKGDDFEAVDESNWQILADSGRVDPMEER